MTPERFQRLHDVLSKRQPDLTVVTDYVHKGRNLSAIVRNCDAVGVGNVHAVIPRAEYRQFRGTAKGSHQWVKVVRHETVVDALTPLKQSGYQIITAHLTPTAIDFRDVDYTRPTAILMGAEKSGVSNEGLALADFAVTIPMMGMVESFNVSVAAGIILSEACHQRVKAGQYAERRLPKNEYDTLFFEWAHPKIRHFCATNNLDYPALREDGEIDNPSAWYARVREEIASRKE